MENKWKLLEVPIGEIVGTEVNANKMTKKDFQQLVDNIRASGLSSTIACYRREEDGKYVIVSGNHRYKACVQLGYNTLSILYADETELTRDEIIAVQLSHNSLHGDDDKGILKRLFDEIQDVDYKRFAHISVDDLDMTDMFSGSVVPISEHYNVGLVLYRRDMDLLDDLLDIVHEEEAKNDMVILADGEGVETEFLDTLTAAKKRFQIKSTSVAFSKILELAKQQLDEDLKPVSEPQAPPRRRRT